MNQTAAAPADAAELLDLYRLHSHSWSMSAHSHLAVGAEPQTLGAASPTHPSDSFDPDEITSTFLRAKALEQRLSAAHPDHYFGQPLDADLAAVRRHWSNQGILARSDGWVLLWNRGAGEVGKAASSGAWSLRPPETIAELFPHIRAVRDHGLRIVTAAPHEQPAVSEIGRLLFGVSPVVDDVEQFRRVDLDGGLHRLELHDRTAAVHPESILAGAAEAEVDLLVAPVGVGGPADTPRWGGALATVPRRTMWVVNGSGTVVIDGRAHHRASLIARSDEGGWREIGTQGVARRSSLDAVTAARWGLTSPSDGEATATHWAEDTEVDDAITIYEMASCRLAVLVGSHHGDRSVETERLTRAAPTHVIRLAIGEEITDEGLVATDADRVAEDTGAAILVANSTAIARHQRSIPPGATDKAVGAALWRDRAQRGPWVVARSRRGAEVMVPQYGEWATPLHRSDLRRGDLMFFLRNPTNSPAFGGLNSAIAGWDQTSMVHVAVVTAAGDTPHDTMVVDSYAKMSVRPLSHLGLSYGAHVEHPAKDEVWENADRTLFAPTFVSRLADPAHAEGLVEEAEDMAWSRAEYPATHVLYAALLLRPRLAGVDSQLVNAWAHMLALAAEKQGDPALMCGEMLLVAAERYNARRGVGDALDLGIESPVELPRGVRVHEHLGRSWLGVELGTDEALAALTSNLQAAVKQQAYFPINDVGQAVDQVRRYLSNNDDWTTTLVQPEFLDAVAAGLAPAKRLADVLESEGWHGQLAGLTPRRRRPARLGTVSDILRSPHLAHLGHLHHWWS